MNFFAVEDKGGQHIRTWGTLELQSDLCLGVQRVRCFPFRSDKAWKSNPKNYVAVIPPSKFTDIRFAEFDLSNLNDLIVDEDLANALQRMSEFCCAHAPMHAAAGTNMPRAMFKYLLMSVTLACVSLTGVRSLSDQLIVLCVPDTQWLIVLPINHILGRVPLMKFYPCGSSSPTIPHEFSHHKQAHVRYGYADQNGREGSGSPLFMLNVHLWQFGRPQARTISVQQRHANKERAQKAANQKRAQRMPYTREKAARRRAMRTAAQ